MILNDIIAAARELLQDTLVPYRYSDAFLLDKANQALRRIALFRPDLFAYVGTFLCTAGEVLQSAPADSFRVIEVFSIVGGGGVVEADRVVLDQTVPGWVSETAGPAVNWMRHVRNPNKFFIYPPAPAAQTLNIEYAQSPPTYDGTTAVTLLSDAYTPIVIDGVVWLTESIDNENVNNGRAKMFQTSFTQSLGVTAAARPVTDTETAGQDPNKVKVI